MEEKPSLQKKLAHATHPLIEAILAELLRLPNEESAQKRLHALQDFFILSRKQPAGDNKNSLILWIKNYQVTPEEEKQGVIGNFALVSIKQTEERRFCLFATKIPAELKFHPQRFMPKRQHPNWGHPLLRQIKKGKIYESLEAASADLAKLHEQYPNVSIPNRQKLYLMIFTRATNGQKPVQKFVLEIVVTEAGKFTITTRKNEYKGKEAKPKPVVQAEDGNTPVPATPATSVGFFTAKMALKRKSKGQ